eukprot:CAMPEP_0194319566 /NCGR_PEP_ID=MMETSP0171-20130528/16000_1 /TAXON_ID=218684 /ORGANISM="Corethron pennatum, Strain L29A3" /LENGTH=777 /DNA_ID=CAMNT_0039076831 /DNA_START=50 /DNA_END=2380 /DNA_ORIENTATION=+
MYRRVTAPSETRKKPTDNFRWPTKNPAETGPTFEPCKDNRNFKARAKNKMIGCRTIRNEYTRGKYCDMLVNFREDKRPIKTYCPVNCDYDCHTNGPTSTRTEPPTVVLTDRFSDGPSATLSLDPSVVPPHAPVVYPTKFLTQPSSQKPSFFPSATPSFNPTSKPSSHSGSDPSSEPSIFPSGYPTNHPAEDLFHEPSSPRSDVPSTHPTTVPTSLSSSLPSDAPSKYLTTVQTSLPSARWKLHLSTDHSNIETVSAASPASCRDNGIFRDRSGFSCLFYLRIPCGNLIWFGAYERSDIVAIWSNCRKSCGYCPTVRTGRPSNAPSGRPVRVPSVIPSIFIQSTNPSEYPTVVPSDIPTSVPTNGPSKIPSVLPSHSPSELSSGVPSVSDIFFTTLPTVVLRSSSPITFLPSGQPTGVPSGQPSTDIPSACEDDAGFRFRGHIRGTCSNWVAANPDGRCTRYVASRRAFVFQMCPLTCRACDVISVLHPVDGSSAPPASSMLALAPFLSVGRSGAGPHLSPVELPMHPTIVPSAKSGIPSPVPPIITPSSPPTSPSSMFPPDVPHRQSSFRKNRPSSSPSLSMATPDPLLIPPNSLSGVLSQTSVVFEIGEIKRPPSRLFTRKTLTFPPSSGSSRAPFFDRHNPENRTLPISVSNRETYGPNGGGMPQYGTDRAALSATSLLGLAALSLCLIVGLYAFPRRRSATTAQVKEVVPAPITDVGSADGGRREEWQTPPSSPQRLSIRFSPAVERSFLRGDNGGPPADAAPPKRYGLHNEET